VATGRISDGRSRVFFYAGGSLLTGPAACGGQQEEKNAAKINR
jgi:hypothetical protein